MYPILTILVCNIMFSGSRNTILTVNMIADFFYFFFYFLKSSFWCLVSHIWYNFNIWKLFVTSKHTSSPCPLYTIERHWGLLTNFFFVLNKNEKQNIGLSKTLKKTIAIDHSDDSSLSKLTPDTIFHTALQLRADLKDSTSHDTSWRGIDMDHVSDVIPNSLCLFLSVLFGEVYILKLEEPDNYLKVRICSICSPGLALHQATRSEKNGKHLTCSGSYCWNWYTP